jgi:hypothetical protein
MVSDLMIRSALVPVSYFGNVADIERMLREAIARLPWEPVRLEGQLEDRGLIVRFTVRCYPPDGGAAKELKTVL